MVTRLLPDLATGQKLLRGLSAGKAGVEFVVDGSRALSVPDWAAGPARVGDGHLSALADELGARLATFDQPIPGSLQIF